MTARRRSDGPGGAPLGRQFYARPTLDVAHDLLGCWLVHNVGGQLRAGRIVETEAYVGVDDLASHASKGRTPRAEVMYGAPGHAYVYLVYGLHHCFNVVARNAEPAGAVLIRALEPDDGVPDRPKGEGRTDGPGRLCRALGIDRRHNRLDLTTTASGLWIAPPAAPLAEPIESSPRIGVAYAGEWATRPWRFVIATSPWVSVRVLPSATKSGPAGRSSAPPLPPAHIIDSPGTP